MGMSAIKSEKNSIGAEAQPDYTIDSMLAFAYSGELY